MPVKDSTLALVSVLTKKCYLQSIVPDDLPLPGLPLAEYRVVSASVEAEDIEAPVARFTLEEV